MTSTASFFDKSPASIRSELAGFPERAIETALQFRETGTPADFQSMVLALIAFYRPNNRQEPLAAFPPETRFREELGLDSLTLTEMVFKLDELLGVTIEIREAAQLHTLGELQDFLRSKLGLWNAERIHAD